MSLRQELRAPAVDADQVAIDADQVAIVSAEIDRIAGQVDRGEPVSEAIAAFNAFTGHRYEPGDFLRYCESRDLAGFAREAARPAPGRVADVTRDELVEIVWRIQITDDDSDYYLKLFEANVPHPRASDLIYWPPQELAHGSPDDIVDAALSYRPIAL